MRQSCGATTINASVVRDTADSGKLIQYITSSTMMNIQSWHSIAAISLAFATIAITLSIQKRLRKQTRAENRRTID